MRSRYPLTAVTAVVVLLAGTGCDIASDSAPLDYSATSVLSEALGELGDRPSITLTGTVDGFAVEGEPAEVEFNVTDTGVAIGTAKTEGTTVDVMLVNDIYYLKAEWHFWDTYGFPESFTKKVDGKWSPVYPDDWPGLAAVLDAEEYVRLLHSSLDESYVYEGKLPKPTKTKSGRVHSFDVGSGSVNVSTGIPHRVVGVDTVEVIAGYETPIEATLSVSMKKTSGGHVKKWFREMRNAVDDLATVYSDGYIPFTEDDDDLTFQCNSTKCVTKAKLDTSEIEAYQIVDEKVTVKFTSTAKAEGAGTEKCTGKVTVEVGEVGTASCEVDFGKAKGGLGEVEAEMRTSDLLEFKPDVKSLQDGLKSDLKKVLDRV